MYFVYCYCSEFDAREGSLQESLEHSKDYIAQFILDMDSETAIEEIKSHIENKLLPVKSKDEIAYWWGSLYDNDVEIVFEIYPAQIGSTFRLRK